MRNVLPLAPLMRMYRYGILPEAVSSLSIAGISILSIAYRGHSAPVNAIAWSPDSKIIASGSEDKTVQVWDVVTGYNIFTSRDHSSIVTAVDWSPDGSLLASANGDGYVQLWDTSSGRKVDSYRHSSPVRTVAWSPDSTCLAFGGDDGTIQVWIVS